MPTRLHQVYLALVSLVATTYFVIPTTTLSKLLLYNGIGLSAVIALSIGIRRNKSTNRRAWLLIGAGQASFLTADIVYYVLEATSDSAPFPSPADAFYLGMYPLVIMGLVSLYRQSTPHRDWAGLVDAGLVAVATFAVLGILIMDSYVSDPTLDLAGRLISLAYPVMDVALLAVAARLAGAVHLRNRSFAMLAAGLCSLLVADVIYGVLQSAGAFETGGVADAFWIGFYAFIGAAALHPSSGEPIEPRTINTGHITRHRLMVLCLVVLTVPVIDLIWGRPFDKLLTVGASMLMFLLVLGRLLGLVSIIQANEAKALHDARHDSLTGLANRVLFNERVEDLVARKTSGVVSVLFVDLDDFKIVNDSLGHEAGDRLLVTVAERLQQCIRGNDVVARLSGDEFAVLLESAVDRQDAIAVAERVRDSLETPVEIGDREVRVSASIGIAVQRHDDVEQADALLRAADVAMYRAKRKGKGRFEFFERDMQFEAIERLDLKTDLQSALDRGQLELYYQPIIRVRGKKLVSVEALLRWNHPTRGLVEPDRFIPLAEQTGLIVPIGRWVLREACRQVVRWRKEFPDTAPEGVCVNLSVRQLHDPRLLEDVADALRESSLEPPALTLEITESMLIEETDRGSRALEQLEAMQVRIAIDDFGTGYSSLSYLRRFPVDTIKIDRSFVQEMIESKTSQSLVRAVVDLAHSLNVDTVAEGVETQDQFDTLASLKCDRVQGYLISRPVPANGLAQLLGQATQEAGRQRSAELRTEMLEGLDAIEKRSVDLGRLHSDLEVPAVARLRWMLTWGEVYDDWTPFVVTVRNSRDDRVEAAAALAYCLEHDGVARVVAMGHSSMAATWFPSRSARAERMLGRSIHDRLNAFESGWRLELYQIRHDDPVVKLLAQQLPHAEMTADQWVPRVDLGAATEINGLLSKNMRRQLRKARNRLREDDREVTLEIASTELEIVTLVPKLEAIHVERDHASGRDSDLDDPRARELWRKLVLAFAASGEAEVTTLLIDDEISAYVIGIIDDTSYRVFDGHLDQRFSRYSPGRLVESAVLERALADGRFVDLDWMAGVAAEKILTANSNDARVQLVARSQDVSARAAAPAADADLSLTTA